MKLSLFEYGMGLYSENQKKFVWENLRKLWRINEFSKVAEYMIDIKY